MSARLRSAATLLLLGLAACLATAPDASRHATRAVLISFDGLGGERLGAFAREGRLTAGGFSAFYERGLVAGRALTVTPSQTSVAHVAAITGVLPARSGIVANVFHRAGDPFGSTTSGFAGEIGAETLWEAAMRQGKRVGVLTYPGADGSSARRRGSFGLLFPQQSLAPSRFVVLGSEAWTRESGAGRSGSDARLVARVPVGQGPASAEIVLSAPEGREGSLEVVSSAGTTLTVRPGDWFAVRSSAARAADRAGAWCRLVRFDRGLTRTVLYVGPLFAVSGYPEEFRDHVAAAAGFWPGQADERILAGDPEAGIPPDPEAFEAQSVRLSRHLTDILLWCLDNEGWDLLIGYQPGVDEIEHDFEPADALDPERSAPADPGARFVARSITNADVELARVVARIDPRDSLFVLSDHGISHAARGFDLGRFLARGGWEVLGAPARPGAPRVQVCAGSGLAHLYLDPALPADEREREVASLLSQLRQLAAAEPGLIEEVGRREETGPLGLDHPNAGDVVVLLMPGTVFQRGNASAPGLFEAPRQPGAHGYRATHAALDASFLALGPGIARSRPPLVALTDVAATVARALGIEPPGGVDAGQRPPPPQLQNR